MENQPRRIHKYYRFNTPGHAHFITFSCFHNQSLLTLTSAKEFLASSINESASKYNFELWAYVFMPDHIHILIYPVVEDYSISVILRSIKQSSSRKIINALKMEESGVLKKLETGLISPKFRFWQDGGGYDRNCRNIEEIIKSINYIHDNPVKRGLVEKAEEWYWSSAKDWNENADGPLLIQKELLAAIMAQNGVRSLF